MSTLRGDHDIMSLMDIMATNQGYEKKKTTDSCVTKHEDMFKNSEGWIRLIPEVPGYNKRENLKSEFPRMSEEEGEVIWNPYVHVPIDSLLTKTVFAPTNPDVEVYRRRSYEKFKKKFYHLFNFIASNVSKNLEKKKSGNDYNKNSNNNNDNNNEQTDEKVSDELGDLWTKLSAHSILERFHFACKLEENFRVIQNVKQQDHFQHDSCLPSIGQILSILLKGKPDGTIIDPILISGPNSQTQKNSSKSVIQIIPISKLLQNEIEFQWKRQWKRSQSKILNKNHIIKLEEFFSSKTFKRTVNKIVRDSNSLAAEIQHEFITGLQKKACMVASSSQGKKRKRNKSIPRISTVVSENLSIDSFVSTEISVEHAGLSFRINETHLKKLQLLFDRNNKNSFSLASHQASFNSALFSLLARYDMLEGAGLQSALNENVFNMLLAKFDCKTECFASPFNSRYERYFSAFPDTDIPFGSLGSFFNYDFKGLKKGACFQANPPFAADFILRMYKRMEQILTDESISVPLMFIVFIPAWNETDGWNALNSSSLLTQHVLLSQKDDPHYYCEGTQHRRTKARYRVASFDTSIFFLQNKLGSRKWKVTSQTIEELKVAFGSNPDEKKEESSQKVKNTIESFQRVNKINQSQGDINGTLSAKKKGKVQQKDKAKTKKRKKSKTLSSNEREEQMSILASLGITSEGGVKDVKKKSKKNRPKRLNKG